MSTKIRTFPKGGLHIHSSKELTDKKPIKKASYPDRVIIPMAQHIGKPAEVVVKKGDKVKTGQLIGALNGFVSSNIHSSVTGVVEDIKNCLTPSGNMSMSVIIKTTTPEEKVYPFKPLENDYTLIPPKTIIDTIKEAGIVGLGGATFPAHVKLSPPPEATIDAVILNGAECEPYLTADDRLMVEKPEKVIDGLKIMMHVLGVSKGYIGIEINKLEAGKTISDYAKDEANIEVVPLAEKYPQGGEKQLIKAVLNREVPSGKLPLDVGVVVQNVGTAAAVSEAINSASPLIERIVTVTGYGVSQPQNLLVRIGTLFSDIIEECKGFREKPGKIISGGPMMGFAQPSLEVPVTKGTSGILILPKSIIDNYEEHSCIRCGKCVNICPIGLMPTRLATLSKFKKWEGLPEFNINDCMECGTCSYVCPAKIPLVQYIKLGKQGLRNSQNS